MDSSINIHETIPISLAPHAGYTFNGKIAGRAFSTLKNQKIDTFILIGPSHHYSFERIAIWPDGSFETPLGYVEVDSTRCQRLIETCPHIQPLHFYFKPKSSYFFADEILLGYHGVHHSIRIKTWGSLASSSPRNRLGQRKFFKRTLHAKSRLTKGFLKNSRGSTLYLHCRIT